VHNDAQMKAAAGKVSIRNRVLSTDLVDWKSLQFIQDDEFKTMSVEAEQRLKNSVLANQFIEPLCVWRDPSDSVLYCLDGRHRVKILEQLQAEGHGVPKKIPANFIECATKAEAAKLVLVYSSLYAQTTQHGFVTFADHYRLNREELSMFVDIPGINMLDPELPPIPDDLTAGLKDKPASLKITFETADELERCKPEIENLLKVMAPGYLISLSAGEL